MTRKIATIPAGIASPECLIQEVSAASAGGSPWRSARVACAGGSNSAQKVSASNTTTIRMLAAARPAPPGCGGASVGNSALPNSGAGSLHTVRHNMKTLTANAASAAAPAGPATTGATNPPSLQIAHMTIPTTIATFVTPVSIMYDTMSIAEQAIRAATSVNQASR